MRWLINLENHNISFRIYILQKNDSIIIKNKIKNDRIFYILDGFIQKSQIFTNNEIICLTLLYNDNIFTSQLSNFKQKSHHLNYHYKFIAMKRTIILVINQQEFIKKTKHNYKLFNSWIHNYFNNHKEILQIIIHRNTKKRLTQLLLILIKHFGIFKKHKIIIPFKLSHYNISTIIGSQRITVNKIMNDLKKKG